METISERVSERGGEEIKILKDYIVCGPHTEECLNPFPEKRPHFENIRSPFSVINPGKETQLLPFLTRVSRLNTQEEVKE